MSKGIGLKCRSRTKTSPSKIQFTTNACDKRTRPKTCCLIFVTLLSGFRQRMYHLLPCGTCLANQKKIILWMGEWNIKFSRYITSLMGRHVIGPIRFQQFCSRGCWNNQVLHAKSYPGLLSWLWSITRLGKTPIPLLWFQVMLNF